MSFHAVQAYEIAAPGASPEDFERRGRFIKNPGFSLSVVRMFSVWRIFTVNSKYFSENGGRSRNDANEHMALLAAGGKVL
jgi:hypothetical protein